ncbi:hypothetical protein [Actinomadura chibensis]|uniref:Uncharacterized protein n=1 Tax=Actinomadura chibensis TaxID=392828 RepID=A0A5D0NUL5_9ACTN|nr:hypothetical protein [Actinomadura chibensis]TYB47894.1 hypothetical protein FXF69_01210 [Actinomadura chibensis]
MRLELENSGLAPEDLASLGDFTSSQRPTGERGPTTDLLVGVSANLASGTLSATVATLWLIWRRHRQRALLDAHTATVHVEFETPTGTHTAIIHFRTTGTEAAETLAASAPPDTHTVRITFTAP